MDEQSIKILLVDNIERTLSEQEELTRRVGDVEIIRNVCALEDAIKARKYHVAIVDPLELHSIPAYMETMSVPERIRHVLTTINDHDIPVIFVTSKGATHPELELVPGKHYDHTHTKPYNMEELILQIDDVLIARAKQSNKV